MAAKVNGQLVNEAVAFASVEDRDGSEADDAYAGAIGEIASGSGAGAVPRVNSGSAAG